MCEQYLRVPGFIQAGNLKRHIFTKNPREDWRKTRFCLQAKQVHTCFVPPLWNRVRSTDWLTRLLLKLCTQGVKTLHFGCVCAAAQQAERCSSGVKTVIVKHKVKMLNSKNQMPVKIKAAWCNIYEKKVHNGFFYLYRQLNLIQKNTAMMGLSFALRLQVQHHQLKNSRN